MRTDGALLLIAAAVRLAALAVAMATGRFPDFWEPEYLARSLLEGRGFTHPYLGHDFHAYIEPLYPFLVAGVYAVTGRSVLALAVVDVALSALAAPLVHRLGRRAFSPAAGVLAGLLVALHPALAGYATKFHPLVLDSLLMAATTLAAVALVQSPSLRGGLALGVALGLCLLTRPTILVAMPLVGAWALWRRPERRTLGAWALAAVVAIAVLAPWTVRNYLVLGAFVPVRSSSPFVFWIGNHPGAPGSTVDPHDPSGVGSVFDRAPEALRRRVVETPGELAKNEIFREEALGYIKAEPGAFVTRTLRKLYYFWWFAPYQGSRYAGWQLAAYAGFYVVALAAALGGLLAAWRRRIPASGDAVAVVVIVLAAVSLSQALFYVEGRHRLAIEPVLLALSGAGLAALRRRRGAAPT